MTAVRPTPAATLVMFRPSRSAGGRRGVRADAVDVLRQQVAVARERQCGVANLRGVIRRTAVALLERETPVAGGVALRLGLGERQVGAVEIAQLAGAAGVGAAHR